MRCLPAERRALFHQGYEPAARDVADMRRLREKFGIGTSF
ncbi:nucleotidyltransferase domain-containing protein [Streptomyces sp. NPDC002913]